MSTRIAARYIGTSPVKLPPRPGDPYLDANGAPIADLMLSVGDTLQIEEHELFGMTYLIDPTHERQPHQLGTGLSLLPAHEGQPWRSLLDVRFRYAGDATIPGGVYAYEFHMGRSDFEPMTDHPRQFEHKPVAAVVPPAVAEVQLPLAPVEVPPEVVQPAQEIPVEHAPQPVHDAIVTPVTADAAIEVPTNIEEH